MWSRCTAMSPNQEAAGSSSWHRHPWVPQPGAGTGTQRAQGQGLPAAPAGSSAQGWARLAEHPPSRIPHPPSCIPHPPPIPHPLSQPLPAPHQGGLNPPSPRGLFWPLPKGATASPPAFNQGNIFTKPPPFTTFCQAPVEAMEHNCSSFRRSLFSSWQSALCCYVCSCKQSFCRKPDLAQSRNSTKLGNLQVSRRLGSRTQLLCCCTQHFAMQPEASGAQGAAWP